MKGCIHTLTQAVDGCTFDWKIRYEPTPGVVDNFTAVRAEGRVQMSDGPTFFTANRLPDGTWTARFDLDPNDTSIVPGNKFRFEVHTGASLEDVIPWGCDAEYTVNVQTKWVF
ncbi:MAG: hypothetical protein WCJ64_02020 [Rhodospirillaceae bacterium]